MNKKILSILFCVFCTAVQAQILGGGTNFAGAVVFSQSWLTGCPAGSTTFSNQSAFEPTTVIDGCAPAPACATGTTESDVWYSFFAQTATATIVVNPSASFDVAIQAFSGSACPGLTGIGCVDAGGNNATETLVLSGLTVNTRYYFRIFGAANGTSARTGTYTFCGSAGLGTTLLPLQVNQFSVANIPGGNRLQWSLTSYTDHLQFEIERSDDGRSFIVIGTLRGSPAQLLYSFTDAAVNAAVQYYRVRLYNGNGQYEYSAILSVHKNGGVKPMAITPGVVSDNLTAVLQCNTPGTGQLLITDASGLLRYRQPVQLQKGYNAVVVAQLPVLASGIYTLHILRDDQHLVKRFFCGR